MANEAEIITLLGNKGDPVEYTIAAGSVIPKGSIMNINSSPKTATIATADELIAGIASIESCAIDTFTKLPCITHCVARISSTTGFTFGIPLKLEGTNLAVAADNDGQAQKGEVLGMSLKTAAASGQGDVLINLGG
jgi:hypothetical protein